MYYTVEYIFKDRQAFNYDLTQFLLILRGYEFQPNDGRF